MPIEICRYVPLQRFCEMLFGSEICLLSPEKWNDRYENYVLQLIKSKKTNIIKEALLQERIGSPEKVDEWIDFAILLCSKARCLCFSTNIDEEVMWNAYNFNKETIMWKTTDKKLEQINPLFDLRFVKYDLEDIGFVGLLKRCYYEDKERIGMNNDYHLFTHKRKMFSYENELRLLHVIEPKEDDEIFTCKIPSLPEFIDGVMVHPLANDSYVSMIKLLCEQFGLVFMGKSTIYDIDTIY